MEQELKLNIVDGVSEFRTGDLPLPWNRKNLEINANINAPSEFWKKREGVMDISNRLSENNTNYNENVCHVIFDHKNQNITLVVDESSQNQITVNGKMIMNPLFEKLGINNPGFAYTSQGDLYKALKFVRHIFASTEIHAKLLSDLKNFTTKITKIISEKDDLKGNSNKSVDVQMSDFDLNFGICTPIFSGEKEVQLMITVEVTEVAGKPNFYLTCLDLSTKIEEYAVHKFNELKKDFETIAIIER